MVERYGCGVSSSDLGPLYAGSLCDRYALPHHSGVVGCVAARRTAVVFSRYGIHCIRASGSGESGHIADFPVFRYQVCVSVHAQLAAGCLTGFHRYLYGDSASFTSKMAFYALARGYTGTEILIYIGAIMTLFPIFFAEIENDLLRVLVYSPNNQLGFMVVVSVSGPRLRSMVRRRMRSHIFSTSLCCS